MLVPQLLLETLEELVDKNFKTFKWYLSMEVLDGCKPIPKAHLEDACRTDAVSRMTESYGEELAVNITVEILQKININDVAHKLKKAYTEGKQTAPSTSSSASVPTAAPATLSAQQGSLVFAPMVSSGSTGTWNVTINQQK